VAYQRRCGRLKERKSAENGRHGHPAPKASVYPEPLDIVIRNIGHDKEDAQFALRDAALMPFLNEFHFVTAEAEAFVTVVSDPLPAMALEELGQFAQEGPMRALNQLVQPVIVRGEGRRQLLLVPGLLQGVCRLGYSGSGS